MRERIWLVRPTEASFVSEQKAHLAYRITNSHLLRGSLPADTHGGWLVIYYIDELTTLDDLQAELLSECSRFGYQAVFFAISDPGNNMNLSELNSLSHILSRRGLTMVLPLSYAKFCPDAIYSVSTSISGGSLRIFLEELIHVYGSKKLVLEHSLTQMKFAMPSFSNSGTILSSEELNDILSRSDIQSFYSPELCLNYCTYQQGNNANFILYDDARTLAAKELLGCSLGIEKHLFLYHELQNIYPELSHSK